ncbi:MAG: hypothetical protein ABSH51_24150, partial [Solirubrobacteraceae bacterium]
AVALALMLYTQATAGLFAAGAAVALAPVYLLSEDRRPLLRDAALTFGGAAILYLPWLPTTIHQIADATSPWHYGPLLGGVIPADLTGGWRVDVTLLVAALAGVIPQLTRDRRRTPEAVALWSLLVLAFAALLIARIASLAAPDWASRYFAPLLPALLLFCALAAARARVVGVVAIVFCIAFLVNASSFAPAYKSDMKDVNGELGARLHAGDLVVVAQPEQTPLAWYYLPAGLRWADTIGPVADPSTMDWSGAQRRLQAADPAATLAPLVASLKPGQQLLYVRPLTEGKKNWTESWPQLVRRRSAQWGQILTDDVADGTLTAVAVAPHNYRGACCIADSAVLYQKASPHHRR